MYIMCRCFQNGLEECINNLFFFMLWKGLLLLFESLILMFFGDFKERIKSELVYG